MLQDCKRIKPRALYDLQISLLNRSKKTGSKLKRNRLDNEEERNMHKE